MQRISNRPHVASKVQYVDRHIEVPVASEPQIIEKQVEVMVSSEPRIVEKIVEVPAKVDLSGVHAHISKHQEHLDGLQIDIRRNRDLVFGELEMQRRALVAIKAQRDIDRKRRLQLIIRLKKQRDEQRQLNFRCKLAIGASLLLSVLSLIIK